MIIYEENLRVFFFSGQVGDHHPPIKESAVASCPSFGSALGGVSFPLCPSTAALRAPTYSERKTNHGA